MTKFGIYSELRRAARIQVAPLTTFIATAIDDFVERGRCYTAQCVTHRQRSLQTLGEVNEGNEDQAIFALNKVYSHAVRSIAFKLSNHWGKIDDAFH